MPPPFWYLRRKPQTVRDDVEEEIRAHLDMQVQELRAAGLSADDARREAIRRFGDVDATREYCQRLDLHKEVTMQRELMVNDLMQDVRISLRSLLRVPVLTVTVLLTVGLGIGATTTIFSAINAALLQPLPYENPDRLVWIYTDTPPFQFRFSVADYLALQEQQTQFERVAGFTNRTMAFSDERGAELVNGRQVSWTYFGTVGIRPALGRDFVEADGRPGTPPAAIVSHSFWQRRLHGRADAIGKPIRLDGEDFVLTGVLPLAVGPLERRQEFFIVAQFRPPPRRGPFQYWIVARLKPGATHAMAQNELHAINRRIFPIWKASYQDEKATWTLMDLKTRLVRDSRATAVLALGAVALVWLIACANASNLLITRVASRRRELAVRAALGASRARVMRHLLVESAVLASGAAVIGVALAWFGQGLLRSVGANYFPRTQEIAFDAPVLAVLAAVTVLSALIFGLIPAMQATRTPLDESLRATGRSTTASVSVRRLRQLLVGSQFAISTPLLIVAGLLLVSLNALRRVDLGFDTTNMITGSVQLPAALYRAPGSVVSYWDELERRLAALPGVSGVAFTDSLPPDNAGNINNFNLENSLGAPGDSGAATPWVAVTPEYFRVLGITLLEGRFLEERDAQTENVESVVVDRAWSKRFFPDGSALGKRFKEGGCTTCPWTTVVGIVSDVKYVGLDQPNQGTVYSPMGNDLTRYVVLRTQRDARIVAPSVRQVVRELDGNVPFTSVATIDELVAQSLETPRSLSLLVAAFALVALVLSAVGIYGVMAHYVGQNAKDISIRLALGGTPSDVLRLVLGHGMTVVAGGLAVGLLAAFASTRLVTTLLFGVSAVDAGTFAAVTLFLVLVSLIACFMPARRAIRLQPAVMLRND